MKNNREHLDPHENGLHYDVHHPDRYIESHLHTILVYLHATTNRFSAEQIKDLQAKFVSFRQQLQEDASLVDIIECAQWHLMVFHQEIINEINFYNNLCNANLTEPDTCAHEITSWFLLEKVVEDIHDHLQVILVTEIEIREKSLGEYVKTDSPHAKIARSGLQAHLGLLQEVFFED